jgi:hypothetical protein
MKIESKSILKDAFELDGKTIPFTVHLAQVAKEVHAKREELGKINEGDVEALGKTIVELYTLIFGADVVAELLDYYQDDAYGLMADTMPVLTDLVFPAFEQLNKDALSKKMRIKHG